MRVGFDISQIAHQGGVGTYTKNLAEKLSQTSLEMVYFYSSLRKPYKGPLKNVKSFKLPPTLFEVLFNRVRNISIERFLGPIDIFHSSDWVQPPSKAKKITTFHDVVPLKYPMWSHPKVISVHKKRLQLVEQEIDLVIAVSKSTKSDLLEISKIPEEKIVVIYEGVSEKYKQRSEKEIEDFRKKYSLPDKFILAISGVGERRNLERVRDATKDFNLVIAGESLPYLSEDELVLLYNAADVLLYPSFYEGFGLPILEAFACGLPVVTSNISSMPEIAGDGALLVNPKNLDEIKDSLKDIFNDKSLRNNLVQKGLKQVSKFTWDKCATETANAYKNIV